MLATALKEKAASENQDTSSYVLSEDVQPVEVRRTIGHMLDYCSRTPMRTPFKAEGMFIDTTKDIAAQIRTYFPSTIDITPVIDRIAFGCATQAQRTGQPLQIVSFDHLSRVEPINKQKLGRKTYIEIFSDTRVNIGTFQGFKEDLKMVGGSSGGGNINDLKKVVQASNIQGFALQSDSIDVSDEKAKELMEKVSLGQAFGGNTQAMVGAIETLAKGGADAVQLEKIIGQIAEIKTLQVALNNADTVVETVPGQGTKIISAEKLDVATPIATALAIKTETLIADVAALKVTHVAIRTEISKTIDTAKINVQAFQIERAIVGLSNGLVMAPVIANTANDGAKTPVQMAKALEDIKTAAAANGMSVRDAIIITLTKTDVPPQISKALGNFTELLSQPQTLPALAQIMPPAIITDVQSALSAPTLQVSTHAAPEAAPKLTVVTADGEVVAVQPPAADILFAPPIDQQPTPLKALDTALKTPPAEKPPVIVTEAFERPANPPAPLEPQPISPPVAPPVDYTPPPAPPVQPPSNPPAPPENPPTLPPVMPPVDPTPPPHVPPSNPPAPPENPPAIPPVDPTPPPAPPVPPPPNPPAPPENPPTLPPPVMPPVDPTPPPAPPEPPKPQEPAQPPVDKKPEETVKQDGKPAAPENPTAEPKKDESKNPTEADPKQEEAKKPVEQEPEKKPETKTPEPELEKDKKDKKDKPKPDCPDHCDGKLGCCGSFNDSADPNQPAPTDEQRTQNALDRFGISKEDHARMMAQTQARLAKKGAPAPKQ